MPSLAGPAGCALGVELCMPLLLMCWFCCWSKDDQSESSSNNGRPPKQPVVVQETSRRRSFDIFNRKTTASATSLHLPSTSGDRSIAHRSAEQLGRRGEEGPGARHNSAPSVIHEVAHRRSWERSTVELTRDDIRTIPLHASPESSSIASIHDEDLVRPCKKHYTNIKSSKKETKQAEEIKDIDATEVGSPNNDRALNESINKDLYEPLNKVEVKVKETKQSVNESIKSKLGRVGESEELAELQDRSGAVHHEEAVEDGDREVTASVEPADYSSSTCYLSEPAGQKPPAVTALAAPARPRHASDGDILAAAPRPESGAFSESDVELEHSLQAASQPPPSYADVAGSPSTCDVSNAIPARCVIDMSPVRCDVTPAFQRLMQRNTSRGRRETAI